ncbi:MAG: Tryptophanyl-tRNA synthetase [Promethearchaeota archaeon CR_4]|nr:MAG: Tryptophanyl-tRNA synthetase [Candidatus Lokiarchaeota archaeon CR_4]
MLRRGVFFAHRDLDWILDEWDKGNQFYLYTGRGPSDTIQIGHLVPWVFTKWLQDQFKVKVLFQLTDDEKFLFKENLSLREAHGYAIDNALSIIALGFDPKLTQIMIDTDNAKTLYNNALPISKQVTFSTVKASFGFDNSQNLGSIFYTCIQAVPAILESVRSGRNVPCLIPHAIDQDPYFRIARDVFPKLGYYKPASIQCKFLPSLTGVEGKMSASDPNQTIFITDSPDTV